MSSVFGGAAGFFAGHACEIPKPGDYFTLEIDTDSLIIIRGEDGAIHGLVTTSVGIAVQCSAPSRPAMRIGWFVPITSGPMRWTADFWPVAACRRIWTSCSSACCGSQRARSRA